MKVRVNRHMTVGYRSFERGEVADIPEDRAGPLLAAGHVSVHLDLEASAPAAPESTGPRLPELSVPRPSERGPDGFPELAPSPRPLGLIEAETPTPEGARPEDTAGRLAPELDAGPAAQPELHVVAEIVKPGDDKDAIISGADGSVIVPAGKIKRNRP